MSRLRIELESDLSGVFVVSAIVRSVCEHVGVDSTDASYLELCAVEAVTNAIKHAYGGEANGTVCLDISYSRDQLQMQVRDQGMSMPEEDRRRLQVGSGVFDFDPNDLDSIPESGMGLEIIRRTMDEASYSTEDGTNCLTLTKYLRSGESGRTH